MPERGPLRVVFEGTTLTFSPAEVVTIGRHPDAAVHVGHRRVSRRHATVRFGTTGWVFEDQGSSNGSFLLGEPITRLELAGPLKINIGDVDGPALTLIPGAGAEGGPVGDETATVGGMPPVPAPVREKTGSIRRPTLTVIRIGRAPDNDIVVEDGAASWHHAEVRGSEELGFEIVDLNSHNGTFVNGRQVERTTLDQLDLVAVGERRFRLVGSRLEEQPA